MDERDYKILEKNQYTFFVLGRIIGGECELLFTDHERLIICFTRNPYPVWIWTPDFQFYKFLFEAKGRDYVVNWLRIVEAANIRIYDCYKSEYGCCYGET